MGICFFLTVTVTICFFVTNYVVHSRKLLYLILRKIHLNYKFQPNLFVMFRSRKKNTIPSTSHTNFGLSYTIFCNTCIVFRDILPLHARIPLPTPNLRSWFVPVPIQIPSEIAGKIYEALFAPF